MIMFYFGLAENIFMFHQRLQIASQAMNLRDLLVS